MNLHHLLWTIPLKTWILTALFYEQSIHEKQWNLSGVYVARMESILCGTNPQIHKVHKILKRTPLINKPSKKYYS